ncbi:MAG: molybdenum cofactor biosynthesis protein MoaE [Solobacterium sp.]|nr:molybdenum cofactor biosynthesis protein MoaE [Solobacterium sp.]
MTHLIKTAECPSLDSWLQDAKANPNAENVGMYLTHTGVVRKSAKAKVRYGEENTRDVQGMRFSYAEDKVNAVIAETMKMPGIYWLRVWLADGQLHLGDTIMLVQIGGDIRPRVIDALQYLVGRIKNECVKEEEIY